MLMVVTGASTDSMGLMRVERPVCMGPVAHRRSGRRLHHRCRSHRNWARRNTRAERVNGSRLTAGQAA